MRWRIIVVKKPVTAHTRVIPKILFKISPTVVFGIPRSFSSSRTVNQRSPSIASRTRSISSNVFVVEGRPERESLSTEQRLSTLGLKIHEVEKVKKIVVSTRSTGTANRIFKGGAMKTKFDANSLILFFSHF